MINRILITLTLFLPTTLFAQATVVQDRANVGQLKRMVYEQWDDWQPSPGTNWLGFPVNLEGFIYWRILHNAYYNGEDLRPWRMDGPAMQEIGSLALQEEQDQQIADSMEAVLRTNISTHLQMSGEDLDIAYRIFFGPKFNRLFDLIETDITTFSGMYQDVFQKISAAKSFQDFREMLDIARDDISNVHAAYMDKGKRIEAYLEILHKLEKRQLWLNKYLGQYALLSKFPTHEQAERTRKQLQKTYPPNDSRIVRQILKNFNPVNPIAMTYTNLLQITRFWDPNIIDLIEGIKSILPQDGFVTTAKEIAAALSLIYLSIRAYAMIIGEGKFEIMQLFRPFVITMVIVNFPLYATLAAYPAKAAGNAAKTSFEAKAQVMEDKMEEKVTLSDKLFQTLMEQTNEIKKMYDDGSGDETSWKDVVSLGSRKALMDLSATITVYEQMIWVKLSLWIQNLIMWIVIGIFKGVCYCIFFIQLILLHILLVLGPLSFAFSIGGAFRDSWVTWTARYISVSFFNTIGFIILNISTAIITYGLQQEIDRLNFVLGLSSVQEQFIAVARHTDNFIGYLFVALLTSLGGIISVPVIATWIIQTAGSGNALFGTAIQTARTISTGGLSTLSRRIR